MHTCCAWCLKTQMFIRKTTFFQQQTGENRLWTCGHFLWALLQFQRYKYFQFSLLFQLSVNFAGIWGHYSSSLLSKNPGLLLTFSPDCRSSRDKIIPVLAATFPFPVPVISEQYHWPHHVFPVLAAILLFTVISQWSIKFCQSQNNLSVSDVILTTSSVLVSDIIVAFCTDSTFRKNHEMALANS